VSVGHPEMNRKPKCIIVTRSPGSGKTTLAKKLGGRLWMPVTSRDEIKEGYVNTYGVKHDQLPSNANAFVKESGKKKSGRLSGLSLLL
jgi:adenylate kinase family enzyme